MNKKGFLLVESAFVVIVLLVGVTSILPSLLLSIKSNSMMDSLKVAGGLSNELLEEVKLRKWDEQTPDTQEGIAQGGDLGVNDGEDSSDKTTFDDIDDFNGWTENPPRGPVMELLGEFSGYSRRVSVQYVDASFNVSALPTHYKQIEACTQGNHLKPVCLSTVITNR